MREVGQRRAPLRALSRARLERERDGGQHAEASRTMPTPAARRVPIPGVPSVRSRSGKRCGARRARSGAAPNRRAGGPLQAGWTTPSRAPARGGGRGARVPPSRSSVRSSRWRSACSFPAENRTPRDSGAWLRPQHRRPSRSGLSSRICGSSDLRGRADTRGARPPRRSARAVRETKKRSVGSPRRTGGGAPGVRPQGRTARAPPVTGAPLTGTAVLTPLSALPHRQHTIPRGNSSEETTAPRGRPPTRKSPVETSATATPNRSPSGPARRL